MVIVDEKVYSFCVAKSVTRDAANACETVTTLGGGTGAVFWFGLQA